MQGPGSMRPPSGGFRPGTGGGGAPMSRAGGPMSRAGMGSSYGAAGGVGTALQTNVEVMVRPVTNQGMAGMKPGSAGPRRQVADRSYYIGKLREKIAELQAEIERLKKEEETLKKSESGAGGIDKKLKEAKAEVETLKTELEDLNYALQKGQHGADPDSLIEEANTLKADNKIEADKADKIFLHVQDRERQIKDVDDQISKMLSEIDEKLNAEPEKRQIYVQVRGDSDRLRKELAPRQRELEQLRRRFTALNAELKADVVKQEALKLQEKKRAYEARIAELRSEIQASETGTLPDMKTRLLRQVKEGTKQNEELGKQIEGMNNQINDVKKQIQSADEDLQQFKGGQAEKYRELEAKDREMTEFFDKFEGWKKETQANMAKTEESIVRLLENISKFLTVRANLPSVARVNEIREDLEFKTAQHTYALNTHDRLKNELELRKKELEKVKNLDTKISTELQQIHQKIQQQEEEIKKFSNLEGLRADHEQKKRKLKSERERLFKLKGTLKNNNNNLGTNVHDPLRTQLADNEFATSLQQQEQKIRLLNQTVFNLQDFISQKQAESDYEGIKQNCLRLVDEINELIKEQLAQPEKH